MMSETAGPPLPMGRRVRQPSRALAHRTEGPA